jgi:hypothetical protein
MAHEVWEMNLHACNCKSHIEGRPLMLTPGAFSASCMAAELGL